MMASVIYTKHSNDCEEIVANDDCRLKELLHPKNDPLEIPYSLASAIVAPGKSTYRHKLRQSEVYYILKGQGRLHAGSKTTDLIAGGFAIVPPEQEQWLENTGETDLNFIVIVSPPWREEDDIRT